MRSRIGLAALASLATLLVACASTSSSPRPRILVDRTELWPELADPSAEKDPGGAFPARRPTEEQFRALAAAERAWRARDADKWEEARERLEKDPIAAFWLARLLIRDVLFAQANVDPDAGTLVGEAPWERPLAELVAMGDAAAPCVTLDLLCHPAADRRRLGIDVLSRMGPLHLRSWERILTVDDPRVRRSALEAMSAWGPQPRTTATLLAATQDEDFGVRAAAWRAFGSGGPEDAARLREALRTENDPFVRRAIVESLASYDDAETAAALVAELELALRDRDADRVEACQRALREVSGHGRDESLAYWQNWLSSYSPATN